MQPAQVADTITVTDTVPLVEVTNTSSSTTIQTEQIEALPVSGRDFKNLVLMTPQTRTDSERGNLAISGQRGINTNVTIDGVDFNNAFFGGTVGGAEGRAPLAISQESIKEFTVITNGASVEFGRSGGGFVNVITKSGTNNLHGSVFYYNQPQDYIADFNNGTAPGDQEKEQYGGSLGGRIIQDKLFYFVSYDEQAKSETIPINPLVLDADIFARYPALASSPQYVQTQDGDVLFGRLDFQATPAHRFMLRGNFTDYEGVNGTSNSQTRTESYNGVEGLNTDAWVGQWSGAFGSSLLNDLNLNYIEESTPRADKGLNLPEIQLGAFRYGEVSFLPIDPTVTERKAFGDTLTYSVGDHVLKGGLEYNDTSIDQVFRGNWRGVFIFNNEADLLAGRWSQYRQFGGVGGLTSIEAGRASFGQKEQALFFQDQWFASSNLTVSGGLRFEALDNPDDPILNPDDRNPNGSFNLSRDVPDMDLTDQISPRLGVSWSPREDTVVRFSAGRFWSRTPAILLAQLYTSNGLKGTQYIISNRVVNGVVQAPTDPLAGPLGFGTSWTPVGVERIDFTQVPVRAAPRRLHDRQRLREPLHRPPDARRAARGPGQRLGGARLHLRRGQAAPAADRHQPGLRRRHRRERAAALQQARSSRSPSTAASPPASRTPSPSSKQSPAASTAATPTTGAPSRRSPGRRTRTATRTSGTSPASRPRTSTTSTSTGGRRTATRSGRPGRTPSGGRRSGGSASRAASVSPPARPSTPRSAPTSTSTARPRPTGRRSTASTSAATASASRTSASSTCGCSRSSASAPATSRWGWSASTAATPPTASSPSPSGAAPRARRRLAPASAP